MQVELKAHQKFVSPSPGAGDRVFYETLWNEKGLLSPMASIWMLEHGLLSDAKAAEVARKFAK